MEKNTKKRGRPVGSTNKAKDAFNSHSLIMEFDKQLMGAPVCRNSNRGWVNWGLKNDYPQRLSELYTNTIIHRSCIDFAVTAIIGDGIDYDAMENWDAESMPNYTQTWDEFLKCLAMDFVLYGSYAFQIIRNKDGKTFSFYHQPISNVRCGERDEDGNIVEYYISYDWTSIGKYPPVSIKRFGFTEDEIIKSGEPYLFVYETYTPDLEYYTLPNYVGGLKAVKTELELIRYDLRSVMNNFSANGFLVLPRVESNEERESLLRNIKNSFVGSDNANSLVVTFSNGDENDSNVAKFVKIDKDSNNVNLFSETNERCIDRIVTAHRIPTKSLIGMPTDGASLGGDGNMLNVSFNLYNKTVAQNNRNAIVNTINKMFALNGIDTKIILKPLNFGLVQEQQATVDNVDNTVEETDITNNNLIEKITNIDE